MQRCTHYRKVRAQHGHRQMCDDIDQIETRLLLQMSCTGQDGSYRMILCLSLSRGLDDGEEY